jgi:hypothetical protein
VSSIGATGERRRGDFRHFAATFGLADFLLRRRAKETIMNKTFSCIGLVLTGSLLVACASSNSSQKTAPTCMKPQDPGCRLAVDPPSVVRWVAPATDAVAGGVSTAVVERTSDKTCMSGKIDPGPSGAGWGAILIFQLAQDDGGSTQTAPFDLKARGVAQVRFTLSNPPPTGILPQLVELTSADCKTAPSCLASFTGPPVLKTAGPVTLALGDLVNAPAGQASQVSDPTLTVALQFYVLPQSGTAFDYDFCIDGMQFLDAAGNEVLR